MPTVVLLRHGESTWNKENRFTGWTDVDLSERGREEALEAGRLMQEGGYRFDLAYTSVLKRAIRTLWTALDVMDLMWIPVVKDWRLNERHYGALGPGELPLTESLKDTVARFLPYWHGTIAPSIQSGTRVLIAAHGNSLR